MSATGERELWRSYFGSELVPLPDDCFHTAVAPPGTQQYQRTIVWAGVQKSYPEKAAALVMNRLYTSTGNILVFATGEDDIKETKLEIQARLMQARMDRAVQVFSLTSYQSPASRSRAVDYPGRKVLVATNVAERGITLAGIATVIVGGMYKQSTVRDSDRAFDLVRAPTTNSAAEQRAGRTGRTCDGVVYRLYTQQDYDQSPDHPPSDIETGDCIGLLFRVATHFGSTEACSRLPQRPSRTRYDRAVRRLYMMGLVDVNGAVRSDHPIVDVRVFSSLGVDFTFASILMGAIKYDCLDTMTDMVALMHGEYCPDYCAETKWTTCTNGTRLSARSHAQRTAERGSAGVRHSAC